MEKRIFKRAHAGTKGAETVFATETGSIRPSYQCAEIHRSPIRRSKEQNQVRQQLEYTTTSVEVVACVGAIRPSLMMASGSFGRSIERDFVPWSL